MNEEIRRAEEARRLLEEPLLKEAFEAVEGTLLAEIRRVDVGAMEKQRDLIVSLQLLHKVRAYISSVVETGNLAALQQEQTAWSKLKRRVTGD